MTVTVFTPAYNRAYIIEKLFRSLQRQTSKDFEWLIVDDGSTDNTKSVIASFQEENNGFDIRYIKQENGGKCRAINRGQAEAKGLLFFTVDSDDYLTDDAIDKVISWEKSLPKDEKFCGVMGNLGESADSTTNTLFDSPYRDFSMLERYPDFSDKPIDGERAPVFYTEICKKYPFPEFEGENFMTEAVQWNRIAHDGYKMRAYNDIIWIYEYLSDGLTKSGNEIFLNNPHGYGLWLKEKAKFCGYSKKQIAMVNYSFYCELVERLPKKKIAECIQTNAMEINACVALYKLRHG